MIKLDAVLKTKFNYELPDNLGETLVNIRSRKHEITIESAFNSYHKSEEYTKLVLIEALILREIAPKRRKRRIRK